MSPTMPSSETRTPTPTNGAPVAIRIVRAALRMAVFVASPMFATGCLPDVGPCDDVRAREVVFLDTGIGASGDNGMPMYAGQALAHAACGHGSFCHASAAVGGDRLGAPYGFDFDVDVACQDARCFATTQPAAERLAAGVAQVDRLGRSIHRQVDDGSMPPGRAGTRAVDATLRYFVVDAADFMAIEAGAVSIRAVGTELGSLDVAANRERLRNWLACGSPVIERVATTSSDVPGTTCSLVSAGATGACVRRLNVPVVPPAPTWASIHADFLAVVCAGCHGGDSPTGAPIAELDLSDADAAYAALAGIAARGPDCRGRGLVRLVPGDPDASLLHAKLTANPPCGGTMPHARGVSPAVLAAVRTWIQAGAAP